jgi:hypothetical protein
VVIFSILSSATWLWSWELVKEAVEYTECGLVFINAKENEGAKLEKKGSGCTVPDCDDMGMLLAITRAL